MRDRDEPEGVKIERENGTDGENRKGVPFKMNL
jgi:hypothetical protein